MSGTDVQRVMSSTRTSLSRQEAAPMKTIPRLQRVALLIGAVGLAAGSGRAAGEDLLEIELRLLGALGTGGETSLPALLLDLTRTGERWERVWGVNSNNRKPALYSGRVRQAQVGDDRVNLQLQMQHKDVTAIEVDVKRSADGRLEGVYTLNPGGAAVKGRADGRIKPKRPPIPAGFTPAKPGEHPRILLRASDIPALKEKLKTPFGKSLFDKMGDEKTADAIGQGLKYILTGEASYAEKARAFAERNMAGNPGAYSMRSAAGRVPEQVAVAYDLCYHAWPDDFKKKVEAHLAAELERCLRGRGFSGGYNWHICSNWGAKVFQGAGFIGLALWGEKGTMPAKPEGADAAARLAEWEADVADWKRLGEVNLRYQRLFEESRYLLLLHNREAIGTGGFRGECSHYGLNAMEMQIEYATCFRRMFGHDLSPYPDATHAMPRMMFCHDFPEDPKTKPVALSINGLSEMRGNMTAYAYPIVPDPWKGAMHWAWNRYGSAAKPGGKAASAPKSEDAEEAVSGDAVWTFLTYPHGSKPQHPAESMPLTWQAPDHGFYGFRNSWKGQGDFILLVHAKAHSPGGWNGPNTGSFHLHGLGQSWNDTYSGREICAWEENRVILPEDPFFNDGLGRVLHVSMEPDGSGTLTLDMDDVYNVASGRPYSMYGNVREAQAFKDARIKAVRAIAVDYSGKSGAPCLFVLVDRITGGKSKLWTWNLGDPAVVPKVAVSGNSFTLPRGGGVLRGTFVAPRPAQIVAKVQTGKDQPGHTCGQRKQTDPRPVPGLYAQGGDSFFLVATIQDAQKPAPDVKIDGEGLEAKVTVGRRRIAFVGTKIVISDGP
jgi:hypothetical protein